MSDRRCLGGGFGLQHGAAASIGLQRRERREVLPAASSPREPQFIAALVERAATASSSQRPAATPAAASPAAAESPREPARVSPQIATALSLLPSRCGRPEAVLPSRPTRKVLPPVAGAASGDGAGGSSAPSAAAPAPPPSRPTPRGGAPSTSRTQTPRATPRGAGILSPTLLVDGREARLSDGGQPPPERRRTPAPPPPPPPAPRPPPAAAAAAAASAPATPGRVPFPSMRHARHLAALGGEVRGASRVSPRAPENRDESALGRVSITSVPPCRRDARLSRLFAGRTLRSDEADVIRPTLTFASRGRARGGGGGGGGAVERPPLGARKPSGSTSTGTAPTTDSDEPPSQPASQTASERGGAEVAEEEEGAAEAVSPPKPSPLAKVDTSRFLNVDGLTVSRLEEPAPAQPAAAEPAAALQQTAREPPRSRELPRVELRELPRAEPS